MRKYSQQQRLKLSDTSVWNSSSTVYAAPLEIFAVYRLYLHDTDSKEGVGQTARMSEQVHSSTDLLPHGECSKQLVDENVV